MRNKKVVLILVIAIVLIILVLFGYMIFVGLSASNKNLADKSIQNFEDCVQAGYPVMESYPRQCRIPDGRNFVEQIQIQPPAIISGEESRPYDSQEFGFRLWYPRDSKIEKSGFDGYLNLAKNQVVSIFLDPEFFRGTNLGEAGVIIGVGSDIETMAKCTQDLPEDIQIKDLGMAEINGTQFHKYSVNDAAAGNFYESTIYRTVQDGNCYEIVELLHFGNIGNYPPGAVQEFDRAKFSAILEKMVGTFLFK